MTKYLELMATITNFMTDLQKSDASALIRCVYLKGSLATGAVSDSSDIDLCIIWDDEQVTAGNIGEFIQELGTVFAQYAHKPYFSVPKVMSYAAWQYDTRINFLDFGQDSYHAGKVLYGEEITQQALEQKPRGEEYWGLLWRNLLFRISQAHQEFHKVRTRSGTLNLKHVYRVLRHYLQLTTGEYFLNYTDIVHTFNRFYPEAISWVLREPFCRKRELSHEGLSDLERQINLLHSKSLAQIKERLQPTEKPPVPISRVGGDVHILTACPNPRTSRFPLKHSVNDNPDWLLQYYTYVELLPLIVEKSIAQGSEVAVDALFLKLYIQYRYSYIAYNWANKLLECQLKDVLYKMDYVYEYLRLSLLQDKHVLYCLQNHKLSELLPKNPLAQRVKQSVSTSFTDLISIHFALENEILRHNFIPAQLGTNTNGMAGDSLAI